MNRFRLSCCLVLIAALAGFLVWGCGSGGGGDGGEPGGCDTSADCEMAEFCEKPAGDCGGVGECVTMPTFCPDIWDPVCGCDDITYGNVCEAEMARVSVASAGECAQALVECFGNNSCGEGEYCRKTDGECGGVGECLSIPATCSTADAPVCGCDNATYGNACLASEAGASIFSTGACLPLTGCFDNGDCEATEYCQQATGECGGLGECVATPLACPDVWIPVCGCDGTTYGNICQAGTAGVSIVSTGECPSVSGCYGNSDCGVDEFCQKTDGECGGVGDCAAVPANCSTENNPVCGCDGVTYNNACIASAAGVNTYSTGACPTPFGCSENSDCSAEEYCRQAEGACGGVGECVTMPLACPDVWIPVCGCDGTTYANACEAELAGVGIASTGACPS